MIILVFVTVMLLLAVRGQHKELMKKTREHWKATACAYGLKGDFTAPPDGASSTAEWLTPRVGLVAPRSHQARPGAVHPPLTDDSNTDQLPLPTVAHYGDRTEVRHGRGPPSTPTATSATLAAGVARVSCGQRTAH